MSLRDFSTRTSSVSPIGTLGQAAALPAPAAAGHAQAQRGQVGQPGNPRTAIRRHHYQARPPRVPPDRPAATTGWRAAGRFPGPAASASNALLRSNVALACTAASRHPAAAPPPGVTAPGSSATPRGRRERTRQVHVGRQPAPPSSASPSTRNPSVSAPLPGGPVSSLRRPRGIPSNPVAWSSARDPGRKPGLRRADAKQPARGMQPPALFDFIHGQPQRGGSFGVEKRQRNTLGSTGNQHTKQKANTCNAFMAR